MRFTAKLQTPVSLERPKQTFANNRPSLDSWAREVLATAPAGSEVLIYESVEHEVGRYVKDAGV